jgi:hypothetical protein
MLAIRETSERTGFQCMRPMCFICALMIACMTSFDSVSGRFFRLDASDDRCCPWKFWIRLYCYSSELREGEMTEPIRGQWYLEDLCRPVQSLICWHGELSMAVPKRVSRDRNGELSNRGWIYEINRTMNSLHNVQCTKWNNVETCDSHTNQCPLLWWLAFVLLRQTWLWSDLWQVRPEDVTDVTHKRSI